MANNESILTSEIDVEVIYIYGKMGGGKTLYAIAMAICDFFLYDNIKTPRIYSNISIFHKGEKINKSVNTLEDIQNIRFSQMKGILIIDEGAVNMSSRRSMSEANMIFSEFLFLGRKKNVDIVFIAQREKSIDINVRELSGLQVEMKKIRRKEDYPLFLILKKKMKKGDLITQKKIKIDLIKFLSDNHISYSTLETSKISQKKEEKEKIEKNKK